MSYKSRRPLGTHFEFPRSHKACVHLRRWTQTDWLAKWFESQNVIKKSPRPTGKKNPYQNRRFLVTPIALLSLCWVPFIYNSIFFFIHATPNNVWAKICVIVCCIENERPRRKFHKEKIQLSPIWIAKSARHCENGISEWISFGIQMDGWLVTVPRCI